MPVLRMLLNGYPGKNIRLAFVNMDVFVGEAQRASVRAGACQRAEDATVAAARARGAARVR